MARFVAAESRHASALLPDGAITTLKVTGLGSYRRLRSHFYDGNDGQVVVSSRTTFSTRAEQILDTRSTAVYDYFVNQTTPQGRKEGMESVYLHREPADNWGKHSQLTPEQIRLKDMDDNLVGTLDDPDDQWWGMSAPYDGMLLKDLDPDTECVCGRCFLVGNRSATKHINGIATCNNCQWELENGATA